MAKKSLAFERMMDMWSMLSPMLRTYAFEALFKSLLESKEFKEAILAYLENKQ